MNDCLLNKIGCALSNTQHLVQIQSALGDENETYPLC